MDKAAADEKKRKSESKKRPPSNPNDAPDTKRVKLESEPAPTPVANNASFLSAFDFTSLPATLITNLVVANLEAFTEPQLIAMVSAYRTSRGLSTPAPVEPPSTPTKAAAIAPPPIISPTPAIPTGPRRQVQSIEHSGTPTPQAQVSTPAPVVEAEPVDPLKMDIDEEELEYEPEKLNEEVSVNA